MNVARNVAVIAFALHSSGALSIYKQFLFHLISNVKSNSYYIFISRNMPQQDIKNVKYILIDNTSWLKRIWFDELGCRYYFDRQGINVDCIISLQNTVVNMPESCRSIVYYHQSIPFYPYKWNPLNKDERILFFYKYFYPLFVRAHLNKNTKVVVQIPYIKRQFVKYFNHPEANVYVMFPDVERIDIDNINLMPKTDNCVHFIYPATGLSYKNHIIILKSLYKIAQYSPEILNKIKVHFTITEDDSPSYIIDAIKNYKLSDVVVFNGIMPHNKLLELYKASDCLLFPSILETLGLPLVEAAAFGLPIITVNLDYAQEVLNEYAGARFISAYDADAWMSAILDIVSNKHKYKPMDNERHSSWDDFFALI